MNELIQAEVKGHYNLLIGAKTAEELKLALGSAVAGGRTTKTVLGRDIVTGLPAEVAVDSNVACMPVRQVLRQIALASRQLLERIPPEVMNSIIDTGVYITGGLSQISSLETFMRQELTVPVTLSGHPMESTARGLGKVMTEQALKEIAYSIKESIFS